MCGIGAVCPWCMGAVVVCGASLVVVCAVRLCPLFTQGDIHRPGVVMGFLRGALFGYL